MNLPHACDDFGPGTHGALNGGRLEDVPAALAMLERLRETTSGPDADSRARNPARELTAVTSDAKILFTRDDVDTTYVSGKRGTMVLALDGPAYTVGRYDVAAGEWRVLSRGWQRFGNALAFACSVVS